MPSLYLLCTESCCLLCEYFAPPEVRQSFVTEEIDSRLATLLMNAPIAWVGYVDTSTMKEAYVSRRYSTYIRASYDTRSEARMRTIRACNYIYMYIVCVLISHGNALCAVTRVKHKTECLRLKRERN